ncbi:hypothetical protein AB0K00_55285 [Dactylosporangium sp. NPDC049525]|uniref:hypothetical protein n=1 Tax=Dactylosporangium sp. NPDC049525 TaxID=3154730 RepID=UPI0034222302
MWAIQVALGAISFRSMPKRRWLRSMLAIGSPSRRSLWQSRNVTMAGVTDGGLPVETFQYGYLYMIQTTTAVTGVAEMMSSRYRPAGPMVSVVVDQNGAKVARAENSVLTLNALGSAGWCVENGTSYTDATQAPKAISEWACTIEGVDGIRGYAVHFMRRRLS